VFAISLSSAVNRSHVHEDVFSFDINSEIFSL